MFTTLRPKGVISREPEQRGGLGWRGQESSGESCGEGLQSAKPAPTRPPFHLCSSFGPGPSLSCVCGSV